MSRKPYARPLPRTTWYMRHGRYRRYILREISCLLVAIYTALMLYALSVLADGSPEAWAAFLESQRSPLLAALHGLALLYFFVYQTYAWFQLAPKAMPLQLGESRVSAGAVVTAHYLAWVLISVFVLWLAGAF